METIYCSTCQSVITMHADYSFACECEGPIEVKEQGGDPVPDSWYMAGGDHEDACVMLLRAADAERHYALNS